jgi:hypothetical protein
MINNELIMNIINILEKNNINRNVIYHIEYSIKIYPNKINYNRSNIGFLKNSITKNKLDIILNEIFNNKNIIDLVNKYYDDTTYIMIGKDNNDLELYLELDSIDNISSNCISYDIGKNMIKKYEYIIDKKQIYDLYKYLYSIMNEDQFLIFTHIFWPIIDCETIHKINSDNHIFAYIFRINTYFTIKEKYDYIFALAQSINIINIEQIKKYLDFVIDRGISYIYLGMTKDKKLEFTVYIR